LLGASFLGSDLTGADLRGADTEGALLWDLDLMTGAEISAIVTNRQLAEAESLLGLTLPDGSIIAAEEEELTFKNLHGGTE
jgi:uncharacterized protein YjbI with pentapeptide repeats